jgi:hypothetical protein
MPCIKCKSNMLEWNNEDKRYHCISCGGTQPTYAGGSQQNMKPLPVSIDKPSKLGIDNTTPPKVELSHSPPLNVRHGDPAPGHYRNVKEKLPEVIEKFESGHGIRGISRETGISPNTIRGLIKEEAAASSIRPKQEEELQPLRVSALPKDTIDKLGLQKEVQEDLQSDLPPVPLRPQGGGRGPGTWRINKVIRDYYDSNRAQIEKERKQNGDKATKKRWNIPSGTWSGLLRRWSGIPKPKKTNGEKPVTGEPPILKEIRAINDRLTAIENKLVTPEKGEALFNEADELFLLESLLKATATMNAAERAAKIIHVLKTIRAI